MKTTKEMIEVMQAYERGEQIEFIYEGIEWCNASNPAWDWNHFDYRVKPKTKYVPFDTAEEFLAAQRKHGEGLISIGNSAPTDDILLFKAIDISIKLDGSVYEHRENKWGNYCEYLGNLKDLFVKYKMADSTPCGKEVEL